MPDCGHPLCALIGDDGGGDCRLATRRSRGCTPGLTSREVAPAIYDEVRALLPRIDAGDRTAAARLADIVRREALDDRLLIVLARDDEPDLAPALARLCTRVRDPIQR